MDGCTHMSLQEAIRVQLDEVRVTHAFVIAVLPFGISSFSVF